MVQYYDPNSDQTLRSQFKWAYRRPPTQAPIWSSMPQPAEPTPWGRVAAAGGIAAGIFGAGFIPTGGGKRVWDYYLGGLKGFEEWSPGKVFRTFQFSDYFSPFSSANKNVVLGPESLKGAKIQESIANMLGRPMREVEELGVFSKGLEFERTGSLFGTLKVQGGATLSHAVVPITTTQRAGGNIADWYARVSGVELGQFQSLLGKAETGTSFAFVPKVDKVLGIPLSDVAQTWFAKANTLRRIGSAYAASQIGRLNRLLQTPIDIFPQIGPALERLGLPSLAVRSGSALSMLGRYAATGMAVGAGIKGLQYLSYLRSQSDNRFMSGVGFGALGGLAGGLLRKTPLGAAIGAAVGLGFGTLPVFDQGLIPGAGTMVTRASMFHARLSQATGATESRREQEALMPGITKLQTAFGFAGSGLLAGSLAGYGIKLHRYAREGVEATDTFMKTAGAAIEARRVAVTGKGLARVSSRLGSAIGKGGPSGIANRLLMRGGRIGMMAGLAAYGGFAIAATLGTGNLVPGVLGAKYTPEELEQLYSGEKEVAVRAGRWWEAGRSRFEGGRAYYRPHWYRLLQTRARDIGMYGTEKEKWDSSTALHPIKALTDDEFKYRWEMRNYYDRPYPQSGTYGSNVPFVTPLAEALGSIIKPPKIMHAEEWTKRDEYNELAALHVPTAGGNAPGYDLGETLTGWPVSRYSAGQQAGELAYRLNELRGLPGFMHGVVKEKLTGSMDYADQYQQIETANRAYGMSRSFWNLQLGGGALSTEAIRRFLPHQRNQIEQYNPIRNTQPSWMPSEDYFVDFRRGDPYTKVVEGEMRLPGPGYEALHPELSGLSPEQYPAFHKFKILADVALWSDQLKVAQRGVDAAVKRGELTPAQVAQVAEIKRQIAERKQRKKFDEYTFSRDVLEKRRVTIAGQVEGTGFLRTTSGDVLGVGGVDTKGYRRQQARVSDFLREYVGPGTEMDVFVHRDPAHQYKKAPGGKSYYMPAIIGDANQQLVEQGVLSPASDKGDPFAARLSYNAAQRALGGAWERVAHNESPIEYLTPFSPKAKFVHQRSAIEEYERSRVWGTESAFWQHPIRHFMKPAKQMAEREWLGTKEIPEDVRKRWAVEEYFDKLKYLKYQGLEAAARSVGDQQSVQEFRQQRQRTLLGANPYGNPANVFSALPSLDRDYFKSFSEAQTPEERKTILGMVAPNQKGLYVAQWQRQLENTIRAQQSLGMAEPEAEAHLKQIQMSRMAEGRPVNEALLQQYQTGHMENERYADWSRRQELQTFFTEAPLPKADWVGFHPTVDLEDVKLQVVENLGCITGEQVLLQDYSMRGIKAKDIKVGDLIFASDGQQHGVIGISSRLYTDQIMKLTSNGSHQTLYVTPNHRLPVVRQSNDKYNVLEISIGELRPTDRMLFPKIQFPETLTIIDIAQYTTKQIVDINEEKFRCLHDKHFSKRYADMTYDFGYFLGWYLAEGNINYTNGKNNTWPSSIIFSLCIDEQEEAQWLLGYAQQTFGACGTIRQIPKKNSIVVEIFQHALSVLLSTLLPGKALDKHFTDQIYQLPKHCLLGLLTGWHLGDGWKTKKELCWSTSSEQLALQGWYILNSLGYRTRLQCVSPSHLSTHDSYRLRIGKKTHRVAFLDHILSPTVIGDKIILDPVLQNFFWFNVHCQTEIYNDLVYDFDIGPPHHYVTPCGILHNSDIHDFNLWESRRRALVHKPYLDREAPLGATGPSHPALQAAMTQVLRNNLQLQNVQVSVLPAPEGHESVEVEIDDDRSDVFQSYKKNSNFMEMK